MRLCEHLQFLRTCLVDELKRLISNLSLYDRLPLSFLESLDEDDKIVCYRAALICYSVTNSIQVPCEMQLRVVLAIKNGRDCLVSAGTGSGKTLPIALATLLDDPDKRLVTLTLSPLKRFQVTQESDFNTRYGVPTAVINEDTPREDAWWTVSRASLQLSSVSLKFIGKCMGQQKVLSGACSTPDCHRRTAF